MNIKSKNKRIDWLNGQLKPEFSRVVNDVWYGFIPNFDDNTISIKMVNLVTFNYAPDCGELLTFPESEYETESGACYGLLCYLDEQEYIDPETVYASQKGD